jgi:Domain of unknown function (DUF4272)
MSEYPIQSTRQVAYRALCLGTLLRRNALEMGIRSVNDLPDGIQDGWKREHEGIQQHLKQWIVEERILGYFSPNERQLMDAELGGWQQLDTMTIYWRCESLGILLWALEIVDAPYYDTQFDAETLLEPLDLMNPTIDFIWQASLRDAGVIHHARDLSEKWHWRASITQRQQRDDKLSDGISYAELIKQVTEETYSTGNLPSVMGDDFPVLGKAYAQLTNEEYRSISSIAKERHYALNWLCHMSDGWDNVPTET